MSSRSLPFTALIVIVMFSMHRRLNWYNSSFTIVAFSLIADGETLAKLRHRRRSLPY
jgi:hypothetical protein